MRNSLKTGAPCVVIGGSGRGASLLEAACEKLDEHGTDDPEQISSDLKNITLQFLRGGNLDENVAMVKECLQYRNQIRVFQLDQDENATTSDLDKAVLSTLLNIGSLNVSINKLFQILSIIKFSCCLFSKLKNFQFMGQCRLVLGSFPKTCFFGARFFKNIKF